MNYGRLMRGRQELIDAQTELDEAIIAGCQASTENTHLVPHPVPPEPPTPVGHG